MDSVRHVLLAAVIVGCASASNAERSPVLSSAQAKPSRSCPFGIGGEVTGGATIHIVPVDPAERDRVRAELYERAERTTAGECP